MSAVETMYRVYVRMPRPDFKRPSVYEIEFFHTNKELARAVYRSLIRYELNEYIEWKYSDNELEKFEKDPEAYLVDYLYNFADYLYLNSYMDEYPEFVFEKYKPPTCSTVLPDGALGDPECQKIIAKYQ